MISISIVLNTVLLFVSSKALTRDVKTDVPQKEVILSKPHLPNTDWPRSFSRALDLVYFDLTLGDLRLEQTILNMADIASSSAPSSPPTWRWVLGFLVVGACWGLTTPFMRRAAVARDQKPQPPRPVLTDPNISWLKRKILGVLYAVLDLLKNPTYAIPLLLNITGSVWFFLLIGQAGKHASQ